MSIEVGIAVTAFIYKDRYLTGLEERLSEQLYQNYGYRNNNEKFVTFSEAVDFTQYKVSFDCWLVHPTDFYSPILRFQFKCCGVRNDLDYVNSRWWNESLNSPEKRRVPLQCCVVSDPGEVGLSLKSQVVLPREQLPQQDTRCFHLNIYFVNFVLQLWNRLNYRSQPPRSRVNWWDVRRLRTLHRFRVIIVRIG